MSTPHIAWAFAQRELTASQRLVLIALAERANGERTCFPSFETLAGDCELSERAVKAAVQYLHAARRLIEIVRSKAERHEILAKAGARLTARVNVYKILRPDEGAKSAPSQHHDSAKFAPSRHHDSAKSAQSNGSYPQEGGEGAKSAQSTASEGAYFASRGCKKRHHEGAPRAHESLNESLHEKKREAGGSNPGGVSTSLAGTAPVAAKQAAQEGEPPEQPDPPCTAEHARRSAAAAIAVLQAMRPPETERGSSALRMATANIVGKLGRRLEQDAKRPTAYPAHSVAEQIESAQRQRPSLTAPLPKPLPAIADAVIAARRDLARRAAERERVVA